MEKKEDLHKKIKDLKLMDFAGYERNLDPELIEDAIQSTSTFYDNINIADIAGQIKANKEKYRGAKP